MVRVCCAKDGSVVKQDGGVREAAAVFDAAVAERLVKGVVRHKVDAHLFRRRLAPPDGAVRLVDAACQQLVVCMHIERHLLERLKVLVPKVHLVKKAERHAVAHVFGPHAGAKAVHVQEASKDGKVVLDTRAGAGKVRTDGASVERLPAQPHVRVTQLHDAAVVLPQLPRQVHADARPVGRPNILVDRVVIVGLHQDSVEHVLRDGEATCVRDDEGGHATRPDVKDHRLRVVSIRQVRHKVMDVRPHVFLHQMLHRNNVVFHASLQHVGVQRVGSPHVVRLLGGQHVIVEQVNDRHVRVSLDCTQPVFNRPGKIDGRQRPSVCAVVAEGGRVTPRVQHALALAPANHAVLIVPRVQRPSYGHNCSRHPAIVANNLFRLHKVPIRTVVRHRLGKRVGPPVADRDSVHAVSHPTINLDDEHVGTGHGATRRLTNAEPEPAGGEIQMQGEEEVIT
mmetsp:Transcript_4639/g.15031  ORF Transcript_4639/g.15031 Transcript_4639/m.15031 type:complete len:452 (+) Transcript_4639:239-1594(+)